MSATLKALFSFSVLCNKFQTLAAAHWNDNKPKYDLDLAIFTLM